MKNYSVCCEKSSVGLVCSCADKQCVRLDSDGRRLGLVVHGCASVVWL